MYNVCMYMKRLGMYSYVLCVYRLGLQSSDWLIMYWDWSMGRPSSCKCTHTLMSPVSPLTNLTYPPPPEWEYYSVHCYPSLVLWSTLSPSTVGLEWCTTAILHPTLSSGSPPPSTSTSVFCWLPRCSPHSQSHMQCCIWSSVALM